MDKEFYTKLTVEQKFPDEFGPHKIIDERTVWDASMEDMIDMFKTICIGLTFPENVFNQGLINYISQHCDEVEIIEKDEEDD